MTKESKRRRERRRKAKTRLQGGIKKRGRQKGKESGGERGQGGAVQTGTKLQTQCVVIHCLPQLLCTHVFVRVGQWMEVCACLRLRVHVSMPECRHTHIYIYIYFYVCVCTCALACDESTVSRRRWVCAALWHSRRRFFKPISKHLR